MTTTEPIFYTSIERGYEHIEIPDNDFTQEMQVTKDYSRIDQMFDTETIQKVTLCFNRIALPVPEKGIEFLSGTEGVLVASETYGLVLRVELTHPKAGRTPSCRVDNNGFILKPLASLQAGQATVDICPAIQVETDTANLHRLRSFLRNADINFWDSGQVANTGRLPVTTPHFPEGVPVVLDRLAVTLLSHAADAVKPALEAAVLETAALEKEAAQAQDTLYSPLRKAFKNAWERGQVRELWSLCHDYVVQGKLVAGWTDPALPQFYDAVDQRLNRDFHWKTLALANAAKAYDQKLAAARHMPV